MEATGTLKNEDKAVKREGIKYSISLKELLLQLKNLSPSRARARSSDQSIKELVVGLHEIIQCLKGPS